MFLIKIMSTENEIFNVKLHDQEDLKLFLQDIGFKIDEDGYLLNEKLIPEVDESGDFIKYYDVSAVLPGSKIVIRNKDYSRVSSYVINNLIK